MFDAGKQYINEKVQQYQQWAAEHPEANEYVKFAAYSGSAYAGYKGAAAMDAAWAARKAAKEKAKAVAREVAAQSRIAQNQAARKAANNAINERAAANASKPLPYKAPAAPKPVTTPKPTANNPSSPKPTNAPKPVMPAPMPYVPAAVARSGADDFAGAVAARAAQQTAKKADDVVKYHPDNNFGRNNSRYNSDLQQKISNNNGTPTRSPEPFSGTNPIQYPGGTHFPTNPSKGAQPNTLVYRADNGTVTSYATYDNNGLIIKRVDMTGAAHRGVETSHVIEYGRNYLPNGTVRESLNTKLPPRKPRPDELQYHYPSKKGKK